MINTKFKKLSLSLNMKPQTIEECWVVIEKLAEINLELFERLNVNSKNSSQSPSKDNNKKKVKKSKRSKKKPGAQSGHKGKSRELVPSEQVDKIVKCEAPDNCSNCSSKLLDINRVTKHQVYDIPLPKYEITEYQILYKRCRSCNKNFAGNLPSEVGRRGFGIRAQAAISLFTSKFRTSKRQAIALLKDLYGLPISVGSISNTEGRVSNALKNVHAQIKTFLANSKIVNIDETGFKQRNKSGWAWILTNPEASYFHLNQSRGKKVAKELIGKFLDKVIISDRYPCYDYLPERNHQVCWAHLKRDFQKISERSGMSGAVGKKLLKNFGKMYSFYKSMLSGKICCSKKTRKRKRYLINCITKALKQGASCNNKNTVRTCNKILSQGKSLWLFLDNINISPTNNLAERQLRPLVIAKKLSFGVQSERGARFIERIFSLVSSCKQQCKDVIFWLETYIKSYFCKTTSPPFI